MPHRARRWTTCVLLATIAALAAACSGGGSGGDGGTSSTSAANTSSTVGTAASLPKASAGKGAVAFNGTVLEFTITSCQPTPATAAADAARAIFQLSGKGTASGGTAFSIDVKRFEAPGEAATFTDTMTYQDAARVYQAQRFEVEGVGVTDLRDEQATHSMLQVVGNRVTGTGTAGPPGAEKTERIAFALDATCAPA